MQSNIAMLGSSVTCEGCLAGVTTSAAAHSVAHGEEARRARTNNAAFFTVVVAEYTCLFEYCNTQNTQAAVRTAVVA